MKIGLIGGYGHESPRWYPGAELAWAADGYDQRALERARTQPGAAAFSSPQDLFADFRPDVVYIGSAYGRNGRLAIEAMESGFPVVSEKPLATSGAELQRIKELTAMGRSRAIAEFAMRWSPSLQEARRLVQAGEIGEPVHIQAQKSYKFGAKRPDFYKTRELFGGIIPWVAIHAIDYAAWCSGCRYESVTALHGNRCHSEYPEMEDFASLQARMTGGVPCLIAADFLRPGGASTHGDDRLRITGSRGVVEVKGEDIFLVTADGEKHWNCPSSEDLGARRAEDLVHAALGSVEGTVSPLDSLHGTAVALAARDAADAARQGPGIWKSVDEG